MEKGAHGGEMGQVRQCSPGRLLVRAPSPGNVKWTSVPEGRRRKPLGAGSAVSWPSAPPAAPAAAARRSADSLLVPEGHWILAASTGRVLLPSHKRCPLLPVLPHPKQEVRGSSPFCKALQEFVIYREETPLGVRTQTPKRQGSTAYILALSFP